MGEIRSVALVVLLGWALRLFSVWSHNQWQPDSTAWLAGDEPGYNNTALGILQGQGYTWPGRVPLYPAWLAFAHWSSGGSYHLIRYLQTALGAAAILLTYLLGRRMFGHGAGLLGALLVSVTYPLIHQSLHLYSEILFTPVLLVAMRYIWDAFLRPTPASSVLAGVWIGLSDLIRPTLLLLPVVLALTLGLVLRLRAAWRLGTLLVGGAAVVIAPWLLRNYFHYHAWFPLATSNAILWQGSPEYYHLLHDQGYTYMDVWTKILYGPGWQAHDPTSIAGDRYWTARALRSIASEPGTYLRYAVEKLGTFWVGDPNADWHDEQVFSYGALVRAGYSPAAAVLVMIARTVPFLALGAVVALRREWRRLLPVYAVLLYATLLHAATHAEVRLSEPFLPVLQILVAGGIVREHRGSGRGPLAPSPPAPGRPA